VTHGPATIDLGVLDRDDGAGPTRPWPPTWRPGAGQGRRRRWSVLLAVLACLPLAGAAPPPGPGLVELWTTDALTLAGGDQWSRPVPGDTLLYALTPTATGADLTAYRWADGQVAWRTHLGARDATGLVVAAGVPIVISQGPHVAAYHPDTGRMLWRRPGVPRQRVGALLLVAVDDPGGDGQVVSAVDPWTGEPAGAVTERADRVAVPWSAPDGTLHLVTLDRDGVLARRPFTGGRVAAAPTGHRDTSDGARSVRLVVVDDLVVVARRAVGGEPSVTAYDAATLRWRWRVPGGQDAASCGPVVCVRVTGAGPYDAVHGVDPVSGSSRWTAGCAGAGYSGAPCTLAVSPLGGGRLWAELAVPDRYTHGSRATSWVIDAATGRRLTGPVPWRLRERYGGSDLLVSRDDRDRARAGPARPVRLWWGRAGPDGGVEVLGAVDAADCLARHPYLLCGGGTAGVTVYRVRR